MNNQNDYVAYEYTSISVKANLADLYIDSMPAFGWKIAEKNQGFDGITLKFKRDAEIQNKSELDALQKQFEIEIGKVKQLEESKTISASLVSYLTGIVGTGFMAGAVFFITATTPLIVPSIIFGVIGVIGWTLPHFIYKMMKGKKISNVTPKILQSHENIFSICKKARILFS